MKSKPDTPLPRNESHSPPLFPKAWIDDEPKMDNMIYPKAPQALSNLEQGSENLHSSSCKPLCPRQRAFSEALRVKAIQSTDGGIREHWDLCQVQWKLFYLTAKLNFAVPLFKLLIKKNSKKQVAGWYGYSQHTCRHIEDSVAFSISFFITGKHTMFSNGKKPR